MNNGWTVPLTELTRGEVNGTIIVIADDGRKSAAINIEGLLAASQRVLALDPKFTGGAGASHPRPWDKAHLGSRPLK